MLIEQLFIGDVGDGSILVGLFGLAIIIPWLALTVKRLHDINLSGWWQLVLFIPLLGILFGLGIGFTDSDSGENKYGPNPKLEVS